MDNINILIPAEKVKEVQQAKAQAAADFIF